MESANAYRPDDTRQYYESVGILAKGEVSDEARAALVSLFREGYYETLFYAQDFPVTGVAQESADVLARVVGVTDAAILLALLTTFAEGIAVGRDANQIEMEHVEKARARLCDDWPKCSGMRVHGVADTLSLLIEPLETPIG